MPTKTLINPELLRMECTLPDDILEGLEDVLGPIVLIDLVPLLYIGLTPTPRGDKYSILVRTKWQCIEIPQIVEFIKRQDGKFELYDIKDVGLY